MDRKTFVNHLRQSRLIPEEDLSWIASRNPELVRGKQLARLLVQEGILTRFQAERLLIGRTTGFILGQYRIIEQIGKGGMGRVYKAEHRTMKRIVALKVLANTVLQSDRAVELFLHEVRAAASLQHPNIVTAYDANHVNNRYYLVLEYVDGPNLEQLIRRKGPLGVGLACDYIRQVANGLQCAHLLGMIHRDIKPANILVQWHGLTGESSPGLVKISDFGLARLAAPLTVPSGAPQERVTILTRENSVMGTPDYLSPEQTRNLHKTDIRSDLYSLGCTFYFLLTGQVPYPGGTAVDKLLRHATETPQPIAELRLDVPDEVVKIVNRLMAKHPDDRYPTPIALSDALEPFAVSGPTPWAKPRIAEDLEAEDLLPYNEPPADPVSDYPVPGSDGELTALASTLTPTPLTGPTPVSPSQIFLQRREPENRPVGIAVLIAMTCAMIMLTLLAILGLLLGGKG